MNKTKPHPLFDENQLCLIAKGTLDKLPHVAHVVSTPDYRLVFMNQALLDLMTGLGVRVSLDDMGKHPWDIFPNWKEAYFPLYEQVRITGKPLCRRDLKHIIYEHVTYWDVSFVPMVAEDGEVTSIASIRTENTDRHLVEEIESRLAAIVQASSDAIIGKTLDGIITSWNPGAEKMYGYTPEEIIGKHISMLAPPGRPDDILRILDRLRLGERIDHYETERITKDREIICISFSMSPITDVAGNAVGAATIARNITDIKEAQVERDRLVWYLQERTKELRCLYQISSLAQIPNIDSEELLARAVVLLPPAWQYPEICSARIILGDQVFSTPGFVETPWMQVAPLATDNEIIGSVTVAYHEERPEADEGPFLKEERFLLDTAARGLSDAIEHFEAQKREADLDKHKREFYRRTILAATEGKLEIIDHEQIEHMVQHPVGSWTIEHGEDVGHIRRAVAQQAQVYGMDDPKLDNLILCIGEAITNAYKHSGGGKASLYWLGDAVLFVVADKGRGIEALALPDLALKKGYTTAVSLGMGYKMMLSLSDKVFLATDPDGTTVGIEMKLHFQPDISSAQRLAEAWAF